MEILSNQITIAFFPVNQNGLLLVNAFADIS